MSNIKVKGEQALLGALAKFSTEVRIAVDDAVRVTAFKVQENAIERIRTPSKSGKFVSRGSVKHEVSKKGDSPNTDTGRLIGSINVKHNRGSMVAHVGSNLKYAKLLEEKLDRPFLNPAKEEESEKFIERIAKAINSEIASAGK